MAGTAGAAVTTRRQILAFLEDGSILVQDHFIPAEKNLPSWWKKALFDRGVKEVWSGAELDSIGMPCGGIAAGQMYLCGDGTLGNWEILNTHEFISYGATNYAKREVKKDVMHGFSLFVGDGAAQKEWKLSKESFQQITFNGQYPVANITYAHAACPVKTALTAYSPFIPLNAKDSALPVTVLEYAFTNTSDKDVLVSFGAYVENPVARSSEGRAGSRARSTRGVQEARFTAIVHAAEEVPPEFGSDPANPRAAILIADFEGEEYGAWKATGDSFGTGPAKGTLANQNRVTGFVGHGLVNTFLSGDGTAGTLTSPTFKVERKLINFKIGGGNHPGEECMNLIVGGEVVRTATGMNDERLLWDTWDVGEFEGKEAQIQVVDTATGGWGHINIDHIEMADAVRSRDDINLRRGDLNRDAGTLALAVFERGTASGEGEYFVGSEHFGQVRTDAATLAPGKTKTVVTVLAWHFPHHPRGRQYANWFKDALEVARYVASEHRRLSGDTKLWVETYYDSTLPYWLLDRLHSTVGNLATGTTEWWGNGRFWAYEGVVCCPGTCTHVWNYEHAMARLFPEIARNVRERQDFGEAFHPDSGLVGFRSDDEYAADGQCGTVLKAYREHTTSKDDAFLKKNWPRIKKAMQYVIGHDKNDDGVIEDGQPNTYDIDFEGANTFIGALYLAALRAAEEMAVAVDDQEFAKKCRAIFESGSKATMDQLWNGEYFFQKVDQAQHAKYQYGPGCLSDQLFGQGWAHHVGLGHLYPKENVKTALQSVWKYNWAPDVAPQNARFKPERPFAVPGEAGLFICTWPKGERQEEPVRYRDEVWTGIEYQVAGHMVWEGLVEEGLSICRAVHDRYQPAKRNPYNEVECSDHYARAMASWGVFTALSGFVYNGPKGEMSFDPRVTPEDFSSAFTAAEGWGTFEQTKGKDGQLSTVTVKHGILSLKQFSVRPVAGFKPKSIDLSVPGSSTDATIHQHDGMVVLAFEHPIELKAGESLTIGLK